MRQPSPDEIVKVSSRLRRTVTNPDGSIDPQHVWVCENAWSFWRILADETLRYASSAGHLFFYYGVPLSNVQATLDSRGF